MSNIKHRKIIIYVRIQQTKLESEETQLILRQFYWPDFHGEDFNA